MDWSKILGQFLSQPHPPGNWSLVGQPPEGQPTAVITDGSGHYKIINPQGGVISEPSSLTQAMQMIPQANSSVFRDFRQDDTGNWVPNSYGGSSANIQTQPVAQTPATPITQTQTIPASGFSPAPSPTAPALATPQNAPSSQSIPFKQGLSSAQQQSITALANKPINQWTGTDKTNWAYATNNASLPQSGSAASTIPVGGVAPPSPTTPKSDTSTLSTGDPQLDALYKALNEQVIAPLLKAGNSIRSDLQITPELASGFISKAHGLVDPYYQGLLSQHIDSINASLGNLNQNYRNQQNQSQQDFQTNLADFRNAAGNNGTAFSGLRNLNENNMVNTQNRNLQNLDTQYQGQVGDTLRQGASVVGTNTGTLGKNLNDFHLPTFDSQSATLEGARGGVTGGRTLDFGYNPTDYQTGSLMGQYGSALGGQANQFLSDYEKSQANNSGRKFQTDSSGNLNLY